MHIQIFITAIFCVSVAVCILLLLLLHRVHQHVDRIGAVEIGFFPINQNSLEVKNARKAEFSPKKSSTETCLKKNAADFCQQNGPQSKSCRSNT